MKRVDVLVVGAGPAGSTTAFRLARAGTSVLLVDRARFPRDKPCGGGLSGRALRELPFSPAPVVEASVDTFEFGLPGRAFAERRSAEPLVLMTQRRRLDHFLVEQATAAGAEFSDGTKVVAVESGPDGVTVGLETGRVRCRALVGADGANGVVGRATSIPVDHVFDVALEGNIGYDDFPADRIARRVLVELSQPPGGYGWLFPKGDHANVGVWGSASTGPRLRDYLKRFCERHEVPFERVENIRGHRLPLRRPGSPAASGRILLVGDAAGLVDPLSGDGMYEAFLSSRLAADSILDLLEARTAGLEPYTTRLNRTLAPGASAAWGAKTVAARYPRLTFAIARLPLAWSAVDRLVRGDLEHPGEERGLGRVALKAVERIARAAGDPGAAYRAEAHAA